MESVVLTSAECQELYDLIDELSGGNATHVFAWDGTDSMDDLRTSVCVKIWKALDRDVPRM